MLEDGLRIGHILDPRSGRPVVRRASVTVWHPDALAADALSTALLRSWDRRRGSNGPLSAESQLISCKWTTRKQAEYPRWPRRSSNSGSLPPAHRRHRGPHARGGPPGAEVGTWWSALVLWVLLAVLSGGGRPMAWIRSGWRTLRAR